MVFGLAGDHRRAERVLATNRRLTAETNRAAADRAGLALLEGFGSLAAADASFNSPWIPGCAAARADEPRGDTQHYLAGVPLVSEARPADVVHYV